MTSQDCILDIHICGACRSEFSDIYKFIQHKKECYLSTARSQGQVSELTNLAGQFLQHFHSSDALQLQLSGAEFQNETYPCISTQSGDNLENANLPGASSIQISLSSVLPTSEYSMPDCAKKDYSHFSHALKSAAVFEHKSLNVTAPFTYSWPAVSDIHEETVSANVGNNVTENELALVTEVVPQVKESVKAENVEESRSHVEISADNIAVYVMSPKSFASSVRTEHKFSHDMGNKSLSDFSAGSLWNDGHSQVDHCNHIPDMFNSVAAFSSVSSKKSCMTFDGDEQQNDLMFIYQDNVGSSLLKSGTSSAFYNEAELNFASNNSTPCPEDLEVGQISAAMFGKKNQQEDFKLILNVSTEQAITSVAESMQDAVKTSFLEATSVLSQADTYKIFNGDIDSIHGYIRENTASAPIIKVKKESSSSCKRRISIEKRERLQGISDDLLSPSVGVTPASSVKGQNMETHQQTKNQNMETHQQMKSQNMESHQQMKSQNMESHQQMKSQNMETHQQTRSQNMESHQETKNQMSIGNNVTAQLPRKSAELPPVTNPCLVSGYKAVFTSPSSGGHRLTPTHADLCDSSNCSAPEVSGLKRQFFARGSSGLVSKSVEYKNISALMQIQGKHPQAELPHASSGKQPQTVLPHTASGLFIPEKKRERWINFEIKSSAPQGNLQKLRFASSQNALQKNKTNVTQASINSLDRSNTRKLSAAIPSLNPPTLSLSKAKTSAATNKVKDNEMNPDGSVQLSLTNGSTYHKDNCPVPGTNNMDGLQICTGEVTSINDEVMIAPDRKSETSLLSQNDDSYESLLTSCANSNPSIVMIYKNVDGSVIMVPKVLYSNPHQKSSNLAGVSTSNIELSLGKEHINLQRSYSQQQQPTEIEASFSTVEAHEDPSHYYLHSVNLDNQSSQASSVVDSVTVSSSVGFPISNQDLSIIASNNNITSHIQGTDMQQKPPICSSTLNGPEIPEKEKFIIKPKNTEGSSKSSATSLTQINKNGKRTSQTTQVKESMDCDVTEQMEDKKSRTFTCKFDKCRYTTSLYKDFQRHYRRHTGEKPYQCPDCGKMFNRSDKLKIHQRRHTGFKPFRCQICDYAAIEGGSLKKHMRIHTGERPFRCQICSYASRNSSQLIVHLRTHTGDSPFHCTKCPAKFKINSDLKRHMRIHTGEKPFQCDKCEYKSSNKGNLKTHMKINHLEENEIHCPTCQFVTSSRKRFREHERIHNVLVVKCAQCEYTCANFGQLRSHMIIHNSVKPYRCKFCTYSSRQSGNLKKHVQNMHLHKLQARSKNPAAELSSGLKLPVTRRENVLLPISERSSIHRRRSTAGCRKLHSCHECGTSFVREDSLRCHMKQHSTHIGEITNRKEADEQPQSDSTVDFQCNNTTNTMTTFFGIQQIVAAASKIYEENYGAVRTTNNHPAAKTKSFTSQNSLAGHSVDRSVTNGQSHTSSHVSSPALTDMKIKKKRKATAFSQLSWKNDTYTASMSSTYESHPPSSLDDGGAALTSHTKTHAGSINESCSQQSQSKSAHHSLVFTENAPIHPSDQSAVKQLSPRLLKARKIEKSFLSPSQLISSSQFISHPEVTPSQLTPPSQLTLSSQLSPKADVFRSQSAASPQKPTTVAVQSMVSSDSSETQSVFLTHQGPTTLRPMPPSTMHLQLQPTTQIQIVLPGTAVPKSAQLVSARENPVLPQQILLQVQGSPQGSQVFTIPVASLKTLQTSGQMLPHIVNHFTLQQNGRVNSKVCRTTESQPTGSQILDQPTLHLSEGIQNLVTSHLSGVLDSAQEVINSVKEDSQIIICSQGQLI